MASGKSLVLNLASSHNDVLRNTTQPGEASQLVYVYDREEAKEEHIAAYNRANN